MCVCVCFSVVKLSVLAVVPTTDHQLSTPPPPLATGLQTTADYRYPNQLALVMVSKHWPQLASTGHNYVPLRVKCYQNARPQQYEQNKIYTTSVHTKALETNSKKAMCEILS